MAEPVERAEDLYVVPLPDFVRQRNALAARLKADGDTSGAAAVKAMRKPPRSAWALNVMARAEPTVVDELLDSARRVAAALGGGGGDVRAAQGDYHRAVTAAVEVAAVTSGMTGDQVAERMRATLLAAGAEPDGDIATQLRAGTLAEDAEAPGFSFAAMASAVDDDEPEDEPTTAETMVANVRSSSVATDDAQGGGPDEQVAAVDDAGEQAAAEHAAAAQAAARRAAAGKAAAVAAHRRARRREQLERRVGRLSQQLTRLVERADAAEAAAAEAREAVRSAEAELATLNGQLAELEHPDG